MALTDEQRAMLQLLLEGGQSYDDIASLLGTTPDEVRSRSREALREMGGADPDAQVQLSDYLLGQADPIGRADAVRHLQNDPEANTLASRLVSQLRLVAPQAELPEIPAAKGGRGARKAEAPASVSPAAGESPAAAGATPEKSGPGLAERLSGTVRGVGSSKRSGQLVAGAIAVGVLLIVGILAIAGVFGGDGGGSGDDSTTATTAAAGADDLTTVELSPVSDASGGSGQAVFAPTQDNQLALQINLTGLAPSGEDEIYIVWLYSSESAAYPLARDQVAENGNLTGAAAIPQEILSLLGGFGCVDVSLASARETQRVLQQAVDGQSLPRHTGETVLRGQIPAEPGAEAPTGADSQCQVAAPEGGGGQGGGQGGAQQP